MTLTVALDNYPLVPASTNNFDLVIVCPTTFTSSNLASSMYLETDYDIGSTLELELTLPVIELTPSTCFTVTHFELIDNTGTTSDFASISGSTLTVLTNSQSLLGQQELTLVAIVDDAENS